MNLFGRSLVLVLAGLLVGVGCQKKIPPREVQLTSLYVQAHRLNLRKCPGVRCKVVSVLRRGTTVVPISSQGKWSEVSAQDSVRGWVHSKFLTEEPVPFELEERGYRLSSPPPIPSDEWAVEQEDLKAPSPVVTEEFAY